jgi:Domain of unknown function (DUF4279)
LIKKNLKFLEEIAMLVSLTLRIVGDNIDPAYISSVLKVAPKDVYEKGAIRQTKSGRGIVQKCGLWTWSSRDFLTSNKLDDHIQCLVDLVGHAFIGITSLQFVERAWLDFCVVESEQGQNTAPITLNLNANSLAILNRLGLPVEISVYGPEF